MYSALFAVYFGISIKFISVKYLFDWKFLEKNNLPERLLPQYGPSRTKPAPAPCQFCSGRNWFRRHSTIQQKTQKTDNFVYANADYHRALKFKRKCSSYLFRVFLSISSQIRYIRYYRRKQERALLYA